jgi:hypothetical protein
MMILMAHGFRRRVSLFMTLKMNDQYCVIHGFHRLSYFLSDQKVGKKSPRTHVSRSLLHFPGHPVAGVGVFDWTDAAVRGNVFLGGFECRRLFFVLKRSRAAAIPGRLVQVQTLLPRLEISSVLSFFMF